MTGGAAGLALAGCGGGEEESESPTPGATEQAGEPKTGGTIHVSSPTAILSLDPHTTEGVPVATYFYSYVVHPTDWHAPDYTIGDLAESWETPDDLTWIFHLRGDAKFQDLPPVNGRAVVAEDVVKSIDRYRAQPAASTAWDQWTERYEAPDPRTFKEVTKQPYGYFLMDLGSPLTAVMAMEIVDQFGDLKTHIAGSGPYTLKSYDPNVGLETVRNPTYYQKYPYVDGFNIKVYTDDSAAQAAFRAAQLDAYNATTKPKADNVSSVSGVSVQKFLDRTYTVFMLNAVKGPQFKDERVREAVDLALDRKQMIDKLCFGDGELAGPVPPLWPAALPKEEIEAAYARDVTKSRQLLSAAGYPDLSFDLSFGSYADNPDRAAIIKSNLAEAGITVNLQAADVGTWLNDLTNNNFVSTTFGHLRYLSDYIQINWPHSRGWAHNDLGYTGVDDDEVDAMIEQVNGTINDEERIKLEQDVQRLVLKRHGPTLTLYEPYAYWAAYDFIKGYTPTSYGFGLYKYDYWIDKG
ncbi:MAG TPA: ABC transporter substrate-binding protein [Dehalococcoidia bacterium]|nr:ABC transporter substrate-binding protein [Dehalococcoidia bacterium]